MIVDISGILLIPGNLGKDCPANGDNIHTENCCNECDYLLCCTDTNFPERCRSCKDKYCPRVQTAGY